jgi:hypothetical protein
MKGPLNLEDYSDYFLSLPKPRGASQQLSEKTINIKTYGKCPSPRSDGGGYRLLV